MRRSSTLPEDTNQRAAEVVRISVEEPTGRKDRSPVSEYLSEIGRKGGLKGGHVRAEKLSAKKRSDIARKAAKSRWMKSKKQ